MTLREKQSLFVRLVASLILHATEEGYEFTFAEAYRPPETAELYEKQGKGIKNSLHCQRLAIDLNLFKDGEWLSKSEDFFPLGEWWEEQHELCSWGGRFGDGNHFSLRHEGRA